MYSCEITAFIVDRDFKANDIDFKIIHERLYALRIKAKNFNTWHAHPNLRKQVTKSKSNFTIPPPNDVKILLDDFKAKVRIEATHRGTTVGYSLMIYQKTTVNAPLTSQVAEI